MLEAMKLLKNPDAERLISTVKQQMDQGLTLSDMITLLNRIESAAQRKGKSLKEVCDESMTLYERS